MVVRFKTDRGGTVGPQGAGDYLVPTKDSTRPAVGEAFSGSRVNVVPWVADEPFALYNFELDGAAANLVGRGTSGDKFSAVKESDYWINSNWVGTYPLLGTGYNSLADFGGSWCSRPLTAVVKTSSATSLGGVQWQMSDIDGGWDGLTIYTEVVLSSPYIYMQINWRGDFVPSYTTKAFWDLTTATLSTENTFIMTLNPASTSHSLLVNGVPFTAGSAHTDNAPGCSTFDDGTYPAPQFATDVVYAVDIVGMAWTRGAADHEFWSAYDWTTETGFAP